MGKTLRYLLPFIILASACKPRSSGPSELAIARGQKTTHFPAVGALVAAVATVNNRGNNFGGRERFVLKAWPFCTGTLLSHNTVMTAEHCLPGGLAWFNKGMRKSADRWSLENEGRVAVGFLFFSTNPELWNKADNKSLARLSGPAMQVVGMERAGRFSNSHGVDEGNDADGIILLRLSNRQFKKDAQKLDPSFRELFDLEDFQLKSYPTLSADSGRTLKRITKSYASKKDPFLADVELISVGYGFDKPAGRLGHKLWTYTKPHAYSDDFIYSVSPNRTCPGDSGGPLLMSTTANRPTPNDNASDTSVIGVLAGNRLDWLSIFERLSSFLYISDYGRTCRSFSNVSDYMMPHLKRQEIAAIVEKWRALK